MSLVRSQLMKWVSGQDALPSVYQARAAKDAMAALVGKGRRLLRLADPQWEDLVETLDVFLRINGLEEWVSLLDPRHSRVVALTTLWEKSEQAMLRQFERGPMGTALRRWAKHPPSASWGPALNVWAANLRELTKGGFDETRLMERHHQRVQRDFDDPRAGVYFSEEDWQDLPTWLQTQIEEARQENRGWDKRWLPFRHPLLPDILPWLSDEGSREVVWVASQWLGTSMEDLHRLLGYRKAGCGQGQSVVQRQLNTHAEPRVPYVERVLMRALKALAPANAEQRETWREQSTAIGLSGDSARPWNELAIQASAAGTLSDDLPTRNDLFPVVPTVLQVVPEILTAVGWACQVKPSSSDDLLAFEAHRPDGRHVNLWVRLYARGNEGATNTAAFTTTMDQPWPPSQHDLAAGLSLCLAPNCHHLSVEDMIHLAHELGHLIHFMEMPGRVSAEQQMFPADLLELPSQLLERYVTPERLAAWVRKNAAEGYRDPTHWRRQLAPDRDPWHLTFTTQELLTSCLDFQLHAGGRLRFAQTHAQLREVAGLPPADPRSTEHHLGVEWDANYAARRYVYIWGRFLIARLLPTDASATSVARTFRQFMDHVGSVAVAPRDVRQAWRNWRQESLAQSVLEGTKAWTHQELEAARRLRKHLGSHQMNVDQPPHRTSRLRS